MRLLRTQVALEQLEDFKARSEYDTFRDAYIERLCIQSVIVICVAEVESCIAAELQIRLSCALDNGAALFISANLAAIIKRTSKSDIAKTVKMFGQACTDRFLSAFEEKDVQAYTNLVDARHNVAHADGSNLSFVELQLGVGAAELILDRFANCIAYAG